MNTHPSWQTTLSKAEGHLAAQQWPAAREAAQAMTAICKEPVWLGRAWLLSARAAWHLSDLDACLADAMLALAQARQAAQQDTQISALTLAAFALAELNRAEQALPLADEALALSEVGPHFMLRPVALSCAAHLQARLGHLQESESLHMQALSLARESGSPERLQMAYDNLTLSLAHTHRAARRAQDDGLAEVATRYAEKHMPQIRNLMRDERLEDWRRRSLMDNLAALLELRGSAQEAQEAKTLRQLAKPAKP
ncbi:hypothetical protein [Roseateles toxinivorans]|uniref:MalT-like TPR region domain-containing protein n=1 Tax=Roseateles toxinivorans TaxID=270368 RepID=A0A4R6QN84_9BURK|nr:hypothetical protein [Roseateles toxinivorans]TDP71041.1 hypothetical protein DES47_10319 [Roseateles toxinivorans]